MFPDKLKDLLHLQGISDMNGKFRASGPLAPFHVTAQTRDSHEYDPKYSFPVAIQDPRQYVKSYLLPGFPRVKRGHEQQAVVVTLEGFGGEAGDLPLHLAGGGPAVCVW